jgi:pectin lyase
MKYSLFVAVVAAFASSVSAADAVKGAAEGFAKGVYALSHFTNLN